MRGPSYQFQACGEESITGPWLLQPLPACQGMLETEVVIAQVIKDSSALPLWLLKAIVVRDKYSCLPTVICFLLALFFLALEEELRRLLSRIWECCDLMHLAVALDMLWNTSTEKWSVFRAPSLPASPPNPDTRRWFSKSRSKLPRPWHRVGKEEARLGDVCRAVPLNGWSAFCPYISRYRDFTTAALDSKNVRLAYTGGFPMDFLKGILFSFCGLNSEVQIFVCFPLRYCMQEINLSFK